MKFDITHIEINPRINYEISGIDYEISGIVNGKNVIAFTDDSEIYTHLNDDSEPELHEQAVRYCETKLMEAYIDGGY